MFTSYEALADRFSAFGYDSPYGTDWEEWARHGHPAGGSAQFPCDRVFAHLTDLPADWKTRVHAILCERRLGFLRNKWEDIARTMPRVLQLARVAYLHGNLGEPVEPVELRWLLKLAREDRRTTYQKDGKDVTYGPVPYAPNGTCVARLLLAQAWKIQYRQEAYADHIVYVVPVHGEPGEGCAANLGRFTAAICTHNGMAGSGCTWTASLQKYEGQWCVLLNCRASISD